MLATDRPIQDTERSAKTALKLLDICSVSYCKYNYQNHQVLHFIQGDFSVKSTRFFGGRDEMRRALRLLTMKSDYMSGFSVLRHHVESLERREEHSLPKLPHVLERWHGLAT